MRLSKNQLYGPLDYMVLSSVSPASPYISTTFFKGFSTETNNNHE